MKLPVNLTKAREVWREIDALSDRSASILLGGDEALVARAQQRLAGDELLRAAWGAGPAGLAEVATYPGELLLTLVNPAEEPQLKTNLERGRLQGPVVVAVDEGPAATGAITRLASRAARVSFSDSETGWRALFAAVAQVAGQDLIALARRYPPLRKPAALRIVNQTAAQNALVGLMAFIPGADMPAMTMNQMKMVLHLVDHIQDKFKHLILFNI